MKKLFALLSLIFVITNAQSQVAQSDVLLNKVLKQLNITKKDIDEELYREKVLPNKPANTVMVIPKYRVNETDEQGHIYLELDAYIVVADNTTGKILYKNIEENAWNSDAVVLTEIAVDTGIYTLNKENRAFGIRVSYRGSSNPNPFSYTDLSLFIIQNKQLKTVLKNYQIDRYGGEWDTNCAGESDETNGVISIDKNKTNGFGNLIIKNTTTYTKTYKVGDDCQEKKNIKNSVKYLKYNGKEYK